MFYILHGENALERDEELARLRKKAASGDPAMAELNTTILDGNKVSLGEMRHACDAIPFLTERRLVIVNGLLGRLAGGGPKQGDAQDQPQEPAWKRQFLQELGDYLPHLPPTTRLFFVETRTLKASHPILKLAKAERRGYVRQYDVPKDRDLPGWIRKRALYKGGNLSNEALRLLAELVGSDLRTLDMELDKLFLYAGDRQVTTGDVLDLVSRARQASIFELVDCVGRRETDRALRLLHHMIEEGAAPLYLLTMLGRQVRILIQVSELREAGLAPNEVCSKLGLLPWVTNKMLTQSRNFSMSQLEAAHAQLVKADWAIKTGEIEDVLALDMLVVSLTN